MAGTCSMLCLILVTLFIPPLGVFLISGCSADFFINILLTILGYLPGHIHAFYLEYVYYRQRDGATGRAPGVYSERIQRGGHHGTTYGTIHN
ncbi:UPF0057-domain-containing protein [Aspergillus pseudonomiae]|uniref:UPF0057-domain-containing protein n=1 Tax=Aspergillus pseudonomiae TaxID=1506151 RepID=A0A5N6HWE5_9EURO|nr:UPF0057-domain-containing protein [Aspergillus pseudonomiae]KAB8258716.1 UPF0057-domain-containing protein [Aspergillus pseudonomiae]KAE8401433.1 UPF0057-domain-containing protein [Aspergillus pseudonomiae]